MAKPTIHGSSEWENNERIKESGYLDGQGTVFGYTGALVSKEDPTPPVIPITYDEDGHAITVARTRSGKGTTQIIPEIINHKGALLCIDPKGENAIITAATREKLHGQKPQILDPWGIAVKHLDYEKSRFNPLDLLTPDSDNLADDAMMIADALVTHDGGDSHWSSEGRALVMGLIVHLVTSPKEEGQRTLGRLREILSLPPTEFQRLIAENMAQDGHPLAKAAANRTMQKSERELSSVISTAQQNTHFLESPQIKESLSASDFDFAALKSDDAPITVYVVLPADRLNTHGRWLRLIVSMAITAMVRGEKKPKRPALFLLDEFAALGKLAVVEQAFGLMAGFGMRIHAILQDLSQLQDLYGQRWQTFLANAAVLQVFGTRDLLSAEYISKLAGIQTIETISEATASARRGTLFGLFANPNYTSMNDRTTPRALIMPEEVIRVSDGLQLLFMPSLNPIVAQKIPYYANLDYYDNQGKPIFNPHPDHPPYKNPRRFITRKGEKPQATPKIKPTDTAKIETTDTPQAETPSKSKGNRLGNWIEKLGTTHHK